MAPLGPELERFEVAPRAELERSDARTGSRVLAATLAACSLVNGAAPR